MINGYQCYLKLFFRVIRSCHCCQFVTRIHSITDVSKLQLCVLSQYFKLIILVLSTYIINKFKVIVLVSNLSAKSHMVATVRLISYYNIIKTSKRALFFFKRSLIPNTIKNVLYIKVNMPTLSRFHLLPATKLWLN